MKRIRDWLIANWSFLSNAASLVGTTVVTSGFGFVYWIVATHQFSQTAVGIGSAAISAMMLIGYIGMLGLGTVLIGELSRRPDNAGALISTGLIVSAVASTLMAVCFAILSPYLSGDLDILSENLTGILIFALGTALTGITLVLDHALVGLMRGGIQLWRNAAFSIGKLLIIWGAGLWYADKSGLTIYTTWLLGNALSLVVLIPPLLVQRVNISMLLPQPRLVRDLGGVAIKHHLLNTALRAPSLILPTLVIAFLSAKANSALYSAWMMVSLILAVPVALTTILYAVGSAEISELVEKIKLSLRLSFLLCALSVIPFFLMAGIILEIFGRSYADQATWSLRILLISIFPNIIKVHYVAIIRVSGKLEKGIVVITLIGLMELLLAAVGAQSGDLNGLSIGWLIGESLGMVFTLRLVYAVARNKGEFQMPASSIAPGAVEGESGRMVAPSTSS